MKSINFYMYHSSDKVVDVLKLGKMYIIKLQKVVFIVATSYVRQPHLFLGCFSPPKVTSSFVRLHHSCEAAPTVVRLF